MLPASLLDLSKPSRTLGKGKKTLVLNPKIFTEKYRGKILVVLINPFFGDPPPGRWTEVQRDTERERERESIDTEMLVIWKCDMSHACGAHHYFCNLAL